MKTHSIHLHNEPFSLIKNGGKKIESRLLDEKRRDFTVGDQLFFENRINGEKLKSIIINLYKYNSFEELYENHPLIAFGGSTKKELLQDVYKFYSKEDEKKFGVVGIEFILETL